MDTSCFIKGFYLKFIEQCKHIRTQCFNIFIIHAQQVHDKIHRQIIVSKLYIIR